jgi:hypothetical protein
MLFHLAHPFIRGRKRIEVVRTLSDSSTAMARFAIWFTGVQMPPAFPAGGFLLLLLTIWCSLPDLNAHKGSHCARLRFHRVVAASMAGIGLAALTCGMVLVTIRGVNLAAISRA